MAGLEAGAGVGDVSRQVRGCDALQERLPALRQARRQGRVERRRATRRAGRADDVQSAGGLRRAGSFVSNVDARLVVQAERTTFKAREDFVVQVGHYDLVPCCRTC